MDRDEAVRRALALLTRTYGDDLRDRDAGEIVLLDRESAEYDTAWTVPFDSRRYLEEGDLDAAFIGSLVVVPKDGAPAHFAPTAMPVEEYLAAGRWSRPFPG